MKSNDIEKAKDFFAAKAAFTTGVHEVNGMIQRGDDVVTVDVRLPSDFRQGHIPGAINWANDRWHKATLGRLQRIATQLAINLPNGQWH